MEPHQAPKRIGRPKGSRSKATIEREARELQALRERARGAKLRKLSKDYLQDMIPQTEEIVQSFYRAASRVMPDDPEFSGDDYEKWRRLKEWAAFFADICDRHAAYESAKFKAIEVVPEDPDPAKTIDGVAQSVAATDDPVQIAKQYQQLVKAARG
jgi:hypothetical protein